MQLIGMLDSPYVRRVAISMHHLGIEFEHQPLSVFRNFDEIAAINPLVKVPTLVCDDGTVLTDSSLILQYVESVAGDRRTLLPAEPIALAMVLQTTGLALAVCEKCVSLLYERRHRPADRQHPPWINRLTTQLRGGMAALERAVSTSPPPIDEQHLDQAGITAAVTWRFATEVYRFEAQTYPALTGLSREAEALPAFRAAPYGEG